MLWQQAHTLCIKNYFSFDCRCWFIETSLAYNSNGFRICFCCVISIINNRKAAHYICFVFISLRTLELLWIWWCYQTYSHVRLIINHPLSLKHKYVILKILWSIRLPTTPPPTTTPPPSPSKPIIFSYMSSHYQILCGFDRCDGFVWCDISKHRRN